MARDGHLDPLAPFRLDGRVATVTGASSGRVLDAAGATIALTAPRAKRLEALGHVVAVDGAWTVV